MTVYTTIMNMINTPEENLGLATKKYTLHEQANDAEFNINDLTRVVDMTYADDSFDHKEALVLGRTRVMSLSETISGRDEDEAWLSFLSKYPIYARK